MAFFFQQKVLFKHCDPAGIVFYPRYFEMMNDCVEDFFDKELGWPFENLHKDGGIPTAEVSSRFNAPSRHGDVLQLQLSIVKLGRSSLDYSIRASCQEELRFKTHCTLVKVNSEGRPESWPDPMRAKLQYFMEGQI